MKLEVKFMKIDMHIHSNYSDGTDSPIKIIEQAKKIGLEVIAITDHNTYKGSMEAIRENRSDIDIISGIEISASNKSLPKKARLHILGYNISFDNENLQKFVQEEYDNSRKTMLNYLYFLKKLYNISFPEEDTNEILSRKGDINRVDIAKLLIKYGYVETIEEGFEKYLVSIYSLGTKPEKVSDEKAISLIKEAGGIVSLAHPSSLKLDYQELKKYILYLKEMGLESVETEHIHIDNNLKKFLYGICDRYNLVYSGGSDFHGKNKPGVFLGKGGNDSKNFPIDIDDLSILKLIKK